MLSSCYPRRRPVIAAVLQGLQGYDKTSAGATTRRDVYGGYNGYNKAYAGVTRRQQRLHQEVYGVNKTTAAVTTGRLRGLEQDVCGGNKTTAAARTRRL